MLRSALLQQFLPMVTVVLMGGLQSRASGDRDRHSESDLEPLLESWQDEVNTRVQLLSKQ
jgi:hypothetical protein